MVRKQYKRIPIEKILLATIATVGVIAAVAIAPGVGPALRIFGYGKKKYPNRYLNSAVGRLKEKGYIVFEEKSGKKFIRLTGKGKEKLRKYQQNDIHIPKPKKWDKKWRVIIFDIPEYRRPLRDKLRSSLVSFGFIRLQNSVWIYPYDCEELITMLKADFKIGKDVLYLVAEKVEYDKRFKDSFGL